MLEGCNICGGIFDLASKEKQVAALEARMEESSFWDDNETAQLAIVEANALRQWTIPFSSLKKRFENIQDLWQEAEELGDAELLTELCSEAESIDKELTALEVRKMLSHELDSKNCYLSINAGAGGTEACDWVLMLSRMYQRWADKRFWKVEVIDTIDGEVAGIKSITMKFSGSFAYGYA